MARNPAYQWLYDGSPSPRTKDPVIDLFAAAAESGSQDDAPRRERAVAAGGRAK
jgi:hypothetical protein